MTLDETEELARAIINTFASPGACDVVRIKRATSGVTIHLLDETVELDFTHNDFFAHVSLLKRLVALLTSHIRARALLDAAGDSDLPPLWLLSSSQFVAEWVRWTGADNGLRTYSSWANDIAILPQMPTQVEIATTHCNRHMALAATLYTGELTGVLSLSDDPFCRFSWSQEPKIRIEVAALPETRIISLVREAAVMAAFRAEIDAVVRSASPLLISLLALDGLTLDDAVAPMRPARFWPDRQWLSGKKSRIHTHLRRFYPAGVQPKQLTMHPYNSHQFDYPGGAADAGRRSLAGAFRQDRTDLAQHIVRRVARRVRHRFARGHFRGQRRLDDR